MSEENKYVYPVEELDKIIDKMSKGITPMMNDQMELEVKLRYKELKDELFDSEDVDDVDVRAHQEMMKEHIERKKREAAKNDVVIIKLSDDQINEIRENMETSIVRKNPNSQYNIPDEELYTSEERKNIYKKLSKLKNCYYNQIDYTNAVKIIAEAIEFSLENDYPWLTKSEARKQFQEGKIKFTYCNLPKLYVNYSTQITDPDILKGVVSGEVTLKSKDEKPKRKHVSKDKEAINFDYDVIGETEYKHMCSLHSQGYDTPISPMLKTKSSIFNRLSIPNNGLCISGLTNNNNKEEEPILFDWEREGAGKAYYNMINNIRTTSSDIIDFVDKNNDRSLNRVVKTNTIEFLQSLKTVRTDGNGYNNSSDNISNSLKVNPEAVRIEQGILQAMRMNNPTK